MMHGTTRGRAAKVSTGLLRFGMATVVAGLPLAAQQCITQSQMQPADKSSLIQASTQLAQQIQRDDTAGVRAATLPRYAQDFEGIAGTIHTTAPHLAGATLQPSSVWVLDASKANSGSDGSPQDTQFFCNLNKSTAETSFMIRSLPQGRYALAVVDATRPSDPWQIAMLLRESTPGTWQLAGLFPRATTHGGGVTPPPPPARGGGCSRGPPPRPATTACFIGEPHVPLPPAGCPGRPGLSIARRSSC